MARLDELRLMAKVARLYYGDGLRQSEITERLNIHQSTVSRLLKRAEKEGIVRITLSMPSGLHPELEDALQSAYGLREAIVVDAIDQEDQIVRDLGAAAAFYLETTLKPTRRRRHLVVERGAAGDGRGDAPESRAPPARGWSRFSAASAIRAPKLHATQLTRRLANLVSRHGDAPAGAGRRRDRRTPGA